MSLDLDAAILELARRFKQYGMEHHLARLRAFYRARRERKRAQGLVKEPPWDEDIVLQWLALLRVPPFDAVYSVLPAWNGCSCGVAREDTTKAYTECVFPGGALWRCAACGNAWLRLSES